VDQGYARYADFFCFLGQRLEGDRVVFQKHTP
jgi:hypothetical protein